MADEAAPAGIRLTEDWTAVVAGALIIGLVLAGLSLPVPAFDWGLPAGAGTTLFTASNLQAIAWQFLLVWIIALLSAWLSGKPVKNHLVVFPLVYLLTLGALVIAGNASMKKLGLEAVIFSLCIGLLISNLFRLPAWFRSAFAAELFVKIGLVLLGCTVIFSEIMRAGFLGLIQALVVVVAVWYFAYWLCKKLKVDDELTMMISSAVSICGVSAAIATAGAIKGDPKKLSYVISMVLVVAIPMMIFMPVIAAMMGLSQEVTGAWLGGSIDTTGAVVASGTLAGEEARKISTIVKFSQNVLLGIAAFAISVYWTYTRRPDATAADSKPTLRVIWDRFPKFVIGFIGASVLFSFFIASKHSAALQPLLKTIQGLWFALAFTSIGLETNFRELFNKSGRRPLLAFLTAQLFNVVITLLIAYILFR